jgi:Uma2 family endonuclease
MNAVAEKLTTTPDELLAMPDEKDFELVDGQRVERNVGSMSSWVGGRLYRLLSEYRDTHALGLVWPADNGFRCFPDDPNQVRKPDVSFVRRGRLADDRPPDGYVTVAPDLAVEVLSPNDLALEVDHKITEYLGAGVGLVWVVNPEARAVRVHRADWTVAWLRESDELSGEGVLPGFACRVDAIFPPTAAPGGPARSDPGPRARGVIEDGTNR